MGIFSIIFINVLLFSYCAIANDLITNLICFVLFLSSLIPFYVILDQIKLVLLIYNIQEDFFLSIIVKYSMFINIIIGIFLFINLLYLFLNA
jgi:hypothetical protein